MLIMNLNRKILVQIDNATLQRQIDFKAKIDILENL